MSGVKKKMLCLMALLAFGTNAQENGNSHPGISPGYLRAYKESLARDIPDDGLRQYKKGKGDVSADDVPDAAGLEHIKEIERLELTGKKIKREFKTRFAWGYCRSIHWQPLSFRMDKKFDQGRKGKHGAPLQRSGIS